MALPLALSRSAQHLRAILQRSTASGTAALTIIAAPTTLQLQNATGQSGNVVTLSASLTRSDNGAGVANETLSFTVNGITAGTATTNASGIATLAYIIPAGTAAGVESMSVAFAGDAATAPANATANLTVTAITTALSAANVSGTSGNTVTLTGTLTRPDTGAGIANKVIGFSVGGVSVGTATTGANGIASLSYSILAGTAAGTQPIAASFAGDASDGISSGTATLTVTAVPTSLSAANATGQIGATVNLTATLVRSDTLAPIANKSVKFSVSGTTVGTATTNASGVATFAYLIPTSSTFGSKPIAVSFAGDTADSSASATGTLTVTGVITTLTVANEAVPTGTACSITATLTRNDTGADVAQRTVSFYLDGALMGTAATHTNGIAYYNSLVPTGTMNGNHTVTATFSGDTTYAASTGTGTLTVNAVPTALVVANVTGTNGKAVGLTATLTRTDTGADLYGETVTFSINGVVQGTAATHTNGIAYFNTYVPPAGKTGTSTISATFAGDTTYGISSGSGVLTVH